MIVEDKQELDAVTFETDNKVSKIEIEKKKKERKKYLFIFYIY